MKFILTHPDSNGVTGIYDIEKQLYIKFKQFAAVDYPCAKMTGIWKNLPIEITLQIIDVLLEDCMLDTSFCLVNDYIFICKYVLQDFCYNWFRQLKKSADYILAISAVSRTIYFVSQIVDSLLTQDAFACDSTFGFEFKMLRGDQDASRMAGPWDMASLTGIKRYRINPDHMAGIVTHNDLMTVFAGGLTLSEAFAIRGKYENGIYIGKLIRPIIIIRVSNSRGATILDPHFNRGRWSIFSSILKRVFGPTTVCMMVCTGGDDNPFLPVSNLVAF